MEIQGKQDYYPEMLKEIFENIAVVLIRGKVGINY